MSSELIATWMGVFVGALGALFAIGAIVAGYMLFRQSREHRQQVAETIAAFQKAFAVFMEEKDAALTSMITESKEELARAKSTFDETTGEARADAERRVQRLEDQLHTLLAARSAASMSTASMASLSVADAAALGGGDATRRALTVRLVRGSPTAAISVQGVCVKCGAPIVQILPKIFHAPKSITCSTCGHVNPIDPAGVLP